MFFSIFSINLLQLTYKKGENFKFLNIWQNTLLSNLLFYVMASWRNQVTFLLFTSKIYSHYLLAQLHLAVHMFNLLGSPLGSFQSMPSKFDWLEFVLPQLVPQLSFLLPVEHRSQNEFSNFCSMFLKPPPPWHPWKSFCGFSLTLFYLGNDHKTTHTIFISSHIYLKSRLDSGLKSTCKVSDIGQLNLTDT